jgi:hypothetical protein
MNIRKKKISKFPPARDHGNSTMTIEQRKFVRNKILGDYKNELISKTVDLKSRVVFHANSFYQSTNKGRPVLELRKSTFYDILREADIPLPNRYRASRKKYLNEISKVETIEEPEITIRVKTEPIIESNKKENKSVDACTQTEFNNIFTSILTQQGVLFIPLNLRC